MAKQFKAFAEKIQKIHGAGHTTITKVCNGNLCLDREAFYKFITESNIGDKPFSIISICGATRHGKSFMMNLILRYFEKKQWEKHNKVTGKDSKFRLTAFKVALGFDRVTAGIVLYNHTFEVKWKNQPMVVILMDTQGIFDPMSKRRDEAFLLTITTLMSSVQIFNAMREVDTTKFHALENAITYGELSTKEGRYLKLQNLILLVRDRKMSREQCEQYLNKLFNDENRAEENRVICAKIRETFSIVDLFCLPKPGEAVEDPEEDQPEIEEGDIADNFRKSVHAFLSATISPFDRLEPKFKNDRNPTNIRDLYKLMRVCDDKFRYSNADGRIDGKDIIEGEDRVAYESKHEQLYKEFVNKIQHMDDESRVAIEDRCKELSKEILLQFYEEVSKWNVSEVGKQYETKYRDKLAEQMETATAMRVLQWMSEQEMKKLTLKKKSDRVFEKYVANMRDCDTLRKLESEHDNFMSRIRNTETEYDKDELIQRICGKYEEMEHDITKKVQDEKMEKELQQLEDELECGDCTGNNAMIKDLRGVTIRWIVSKLQMSLRELWIELLNDTANTRNKNLRIRKDTWRETKFLTLEERDMDTIYVRAKSKVLGSYWDCVLQDIEKSNIEKLNKKLLNELAKSVKSRPPKKYLPLNISGTPSVFLMASVADARRLVRRIVAGVARWVPGRNKSGPGKEEYTSMANRAAEEFWKIFAEDGAAHLTGDIATPPDLFWVNYLGKFESVNITFLNEICPALMDGYRELEVILKKSKEEMAAMRKNIREDMETKLTLFMKHIIITIRKEFQQVMVGRHYNPVPLEAKYMQRLNRGFNNMYDDVIGFGSKAKIKELIFERAMVKQSLGNILEENAKNKDAIDNNLEYIDLDESIFRKISDFFTSLFQNND